MIIIYVIVLLIIVRGTMEYLSINEKKQKEEQYEITEKISKNFKDFQEIVCRFQRKTQTYVIDVLEYNSNTIKLLALNPLNHILEMYDIRFSSSNFVTDIKLLSNNDSKPKIFSNKNERYHF